MTEQQAWEYLRDSFSKPLTFNEGVGVGSCYIKTGEFHSCCLCDAIGDLEESKMITELVQDNMLKKVERYGPEHRTLDAYYAVIWPLNPEGAALRVKFCELMLKEFNDNA